MSDSIYALFLQTTNTNDHNNFYLNRYCKFINSIIISGENIKRPHTENHHILPKCMNGNDEKSNLIYLTYRQHFIAHFLLAKAFYNHPIVYAITKMNKNNEIRNSRLYSIAKKLCSEYSRNKQVKKIQITNEINMKHIGVNDPIPNGWRKGAPKRNKPSENKNKIMINNGIVQEYVASIDDIPEGWEKGRINAACQGRMKIHNGIIEKSILKTEEIPEGFIKGRLKKSTLNTIIITDGEREMFLDKTLEIPEGFIKGRLGKGPNNGRKWVNNGEINVFLKPEETIPPGFVKGKL